jgi:hypothetical protein
METGKPGHSCGPDSCCDCDCQAASYDSEMLELLRKERDALLRSQKTMRLIDVMVLASRNEIIECKPPRGFTYTISDGDLKDIFKSFEMHNLNETGWTAKVVKPHG